jgi:methionine synthase I (cobalamin-dependent)/5,10-methylenetetrahydrofolate reductase
MTHPFLIALKERPLLADGAMGTLLYERGASAETCFEQLNLSGEAQKLVQQCHIDYINAGAEVIETNSFSGNRFRLSNFGLDNKVWEINVWAAKVARNAREVAGQPTFVAGSVGPSGKFLAPIGEITEQQLEDAFREQMEGLLAGGVDLFMIETMSGLEETAIAIRAARKVSKLPVVAQISFSVEGHSLMGNTPEDVTKMLETLGTDAPDVIGINCGAGPGPLLDSLVRLTTSVREKFGDRFMFSCLPNAGMPAMVGGRFMYMSRPDYCASFVEPYVNAGARLIGGCCGTTPEHIESMRTALNRFVTTHGAGPVAAGSRPVSNPVQVTSEFSVIETEGAAKIEVTAKKADRSAVLSSDLPGLASKLSKEPGKGFYISVELDPPKGTVAKKIIQAAQKFYDSGADAINVGDSPMARVRMSSMATCHLIRQQVGIETIIHFTTRDRNLMGIQADLLGCQALGISTVLALTGDPPSVGNYAHATAVYDVDSIGLIKIIGQLNQGTDIAGNSIGSPTKLSIGCALNPTAENRQQEKDRFGKKLEAGAHFVMTQPIYQPSDLTDFLDEFGQCPVPILVGIMPLHSFKHAEYLHNEVPGISIPEPVRKAMERAGEEGARVGMELAEELMNEIRSICSGVYIVPSFGRYDDMCALVARMKSVATVAN